MGFGNKNAIAKVIQEVSTFSPLFSATGPDLKFIQSFDSNVKRKIAKRIFFIINAQSVRAYLKTYRALLESDQGPIFGNSVVEKDGIEYLRLPPQLNPLKTAFSENLNFDQHLHENMYIEQRSIRSVLAFCVFLGMRNSKNRLFDLETDPILQFWKDARVNQVKNRDLDTPVTEAERLSLASREQSPCPDQLFSSNEVLNHALFNADNLSTAVRLEPLLMATQDFPNFLMRIDEKKSFDFDPSYRAEFGYQTRVAIAFLLMSFQEDFFSFSSKDVLLVLEALSLKRSRKDGKGFSGDVEAVKQLRSLVFRKKSVL